MPLVRAFLRREDRPMILDVPPADDAVPLVFFHVRALLQRSFARAELIGDKGAHFRQVVGLADVVEGFVVVRLEEKMETTTINRNKKLNVAPQPIGFEAILTPQVGHVTALELT